MVFEASWTLLTNAKARCFRGANTITRKRNTLAVWSVFPASTKYFDPSPAPFLINYIVEDMNALLDRLKQRE
jgi:hypothetical protein